MPIERALISVSDKTGLVDLAQELARGGIEIYSTGGTARELASHGLPVKEVSQYTGFPEILDGRVKTLHPRVAGGILSRRDHRADCEALAAHGILPFDLVVVNLYPFEETVRRDNVTDEEAIEQIDIGGPTLIRAAAKNHKFVTVVTDPSQYARVLDELERHRETTLELRRQLAREAFERTARYDCAISNYFGAEGSQEEFPELLRLELRRRCMLRYGENPHQQAAFYVEPDCDRPSVATAQQLSGKELSFNNLLDLDSALALVREFAAPAAVVIKHNNPCGAACDETLATAFVRAYEGDPLSAFGSVVGFNRSVDDATAEAMCEPGQFIEAAIAPDFSNSAVAMLTTRPTWKHSVRLMKTGDLSRPSRTRPTRDYRRVSGGLLVQTPDCEPDRPADWQTVTRREPTANERVDLEFAWKVVRHVKSNAIVLAAGRQVVGVGAGQMSRVDPVWIAARKAGDRSRGAVLASEAFFPFRDGIDEAARAGATAVVQPGGSRRDEEVIRAANEHNIAMVFTGRRHFRH